MKSASKDGTTDSIYAFLPANSIFELSSNSKMPESSFDLPTKNCHVGKLLRTSVFSSIYTCGHCYAARLEKLRPNYLAKLERNLANLNHPAWVSAATIAIRNSVQKWFRWHASGDIQSEAHYERICQVAHNIPYINFWLPTLEIMRVTETEYPPRNLCVRISSPRLNIPRRIRDYPTSSVKAARLSKWKVLVESNNNETYHCPSHLQGNRCNECRACWDPNIKHVIYRKH